MAVLSAGAAAGCYGHLRGGAEGAAGDGAAGEMIRVPEGRFSRGDLNGEPSEYPERPIEMSAFSIDRFEVSNRAYRLCVRARSCDPTPYLGDPVLGRENHPVVGLSWNDARRFCRWVGRRLPTEAEWEYAAKGIDDRRFPWGGKFDPERANTDRVDDPYKATAPVDAMAGGDSPFGARNMAGNAAEWVADFFDPMYYRTSGDEPNPLGPPTGRERVVRGGSYRDSPYLVRVAARRAQSPTDVDNTIGVRCAR